MERGSSHFRFRSSRSLEVSSSAAMAGISPVVARPLAGRFLGFLASRSYGSSAAAQLQYDYYEEEESELYEDRRWLSKTMTDSEGSAPGRGVQWVLIGEPGAKKHVYAERLSKLLEVPHISMGSLVRQELNPRSSLYKQIANAVNQGKLVPEEIIFGLLSKRLEDGYCRGETGFILDGIPRTRIQAEILDQIADIDLVVNFKCMEEHMMKKHQLPTGTYSACREFHSMINPDPNLNQHLQNNQLKEKTQLYAEQSKPLEDYYRKQMKLIDFKVAGAPGETWQGLLAALNLQHVNAINSSQKLTA